MNLGNSLELLSLVFLLLRELAIDVFFLVPRAEWELTFLEMKLFELTKADLF